MNSAITIIDINLTDLRVGTRVSFTCLSNRCEWGRPPSKKDTGARHTVVVKLFLWMLGLVGWASVPNSFLLPGSQKLFRDSNPLQTIQLCQCSPLVSSFEVSSLERLSGPFKRHLRGTSSQEPRGANQTLTRFHWARQTLCLIGTPTRDAFVKSSVEVCWMLLSTFSGATNLTWLIYFA